MKAKCDPLSRIFQAQLTHQPRNLFLYKSDIDFIIYSYLIKVQHL